MLPTLIFLGLCVCISLFHLSLSLGAPLGAYTLGGKFPEKLPPKMRVIALAQIVVLMGFAAIVASKAGLGLAWLSEISQVGIWLILGFLAFGSIINLFSPSVKERWVMGPLNIIALVCVLAVALG